MTRTREFLPVVFAILATGGLAHANPADVVRGDPADWPMYNRDPEGTRHNSAERALCPANVPGLGIRWSFTTSSPVTGTPAVVRDVVYAGDLSGVVYALSRDGVPVWISEAGAPISASALVTNRHVIVGDLGGFVRGFDVDTGQLRWVVRPNPHPLAVIQGSATMVGRHVAVGVASNEEGVSGTPGYPCCSHRGSVVLLDPEDGSIVWQTYLISDAEAAAGASGSSVWSTPTYDSASGTIYVTTGNNFSQPTNGTSDAIIALDARTGAIRWIDQLTPNDEWNYNFPFSGEHPDADFGDSPQIYRLPDGRKVVGAGQKSGFYHVVDAQTGELLSQSQFEVGGLLGGLFADSALADGVVFANGVNWPDPLSLLPPMSGDLIAFTSDASAQLWRFQTPDSPNLSGVAVANGVVYFQSSFAGILYALDARTGNALAAVPVGLGASGPSVSRGQVYVGVGNALAPNASPGAIVALGLDDQSAGSSCGGPPP